MITLKFHRRLNGRTEPMGSVAIDGDHVDRNGPVGDLLETPMPHPERRGERLTFDEDPQLWARHCERIFRTGYLIVERSES